CCTEQDCCYRKLENRRCGTASLKCNFTLRWDLIVCEDRTYFKRQWCKCDRIAIICFARNMKTYSIKLQYYS
ncbi:hypothetical protein CapIbe_001854, partial [Capra ibex]